MKKISGIRLFLAFFLVSLIIYANSIKGEFVFDDKALIVANNDIKHLSTIPLLFTSDIFKFSFTSFEFKYNYYRPISSLVSAIVYRFSGLNTIGYHLANILIHSLNVLLVFYLIYRLFADYRLALLTGMLFCAHPLHTEAVSYISSLAELLVGLFVLLAVISYLHYTTSRKWTGYLVSLLSFVLALLSREAGFLLFVPFFLLTIGLRSRLDRSAVLAHFLSFLGILLIYIRLRLTFLVPIQYFPDGNLSPFMDVINFFNVLFEYIKLLIAPSSLHVFRAITPIRWVYSSEVIRPLLLLILLAFITIVCVKRKKYSIVFGISWFMLGLLHLVRFMYKFEGYIAMEEHWAYFASIGFFVALSGLILSINKRKLVIALSGFLIFYYGALTFINSGHWKSEIDFYSHNLKLIKPGLSIIPRLNYVTTLYKQSRYKEAIEQIDTILSLSPNNLFAYIELGNIYYSMKNYPEAKAAYGQALKIDYFCWQANRKLKLIANETGEEFEDDIDPRLSPAEARIISFIRLGEFGNALEDLKKVMLDSPTVQFYTLSGITFWKMGLYLQAEEAFKAALAKDPNYTHALNNLAVVYEIRHDTTKAVQTRRRLAEIEGAK